MGIKSVTAQRTGGLKTFEEMGGSMLTSAMKRNDPHCKANAGESWSRGETVTLAEPRYHWASDLKSSGIWGSPRPPTCPKGNLITGYPLSGEQFWET